MKEKIKALVVDDDEKWRKALSATMVKLGCEVRSIADAQTAIDFLIADQTINVLILDWDLRRSISLPTAIGEDVLHAVVTYRNDLTVVIVTGALYNPEYLDWRKELFGVTPVDDAFMMARWQPFLLISKKDLELELKSGLPSLTERLKDVGLIEETMRKSGLLDAEIRPQKTFKATPPFQLDLGEPRLIDSKKRPIPLFDTRLYNVLRALMYKPPGSGGVIYGSLTDWQIATLYNDGVPPDNQADARRVARQFGRSLRRHFKQYGVADRYALIKSQKGIGYTIGNAWHSEKPVIGSEASITYREDVDQFEDKQANDEWDTEF